MGEPRSFIESELNQQAFSQITRCDTDRVKVLNPVQDRFNFIKFDLFKIAIFTKTFLNIFQRGFQIAIILYRVNDHGGNSDFSFGEGCQTHLP